MSEIRFDDEKERKMKGLSKAIYIIAKILKVITIVGMVGIIIGMLAIGIVGSTVKVNNNQIKVVGETIDYERSKDEVTFKVTYKGKEYKETVTKDMDVLVLNRSLKFLEGRNTTTLVIIAEGVLIVAGGVLVVLILTLNEVIRLFKNIHEGNTPFTDENIKRIRKIATYLIIGAVVKIFATGVGNVFINSSFNMNVDLSDILYILITFLIAYVFEYGYELELRKGDMNE